MENKYFFSVKKGENTDHVVVIFHKNSAFQILLCINLYRGKRKRKIKIIIP